MSKLCRVIAGLLVLLSGSAYAETFVTDGWARETVPGQDVGMVDLTITNKQDGVLLGGTTPAAKSIEIHSMTHDNGMMKMRQVPSVELPNDISVNLREQGYHLMLIGLNAPLKAGDIIPLKLHIQSADKQVVEVDGEAEVRSLTGAQPQSQHDHHSHNR